MRGVHANGGNANGGMVVVGSELEIKRENLSGGRKKVEKQGERT